MSKINRLRFINLNYNNNTMAIDDESFYLDGENTMLNLRNGGGKSVLVQMVMAPFVTKRHRNLADRTFESYFTSATPTYILVEWQLDDGAGYLLTGMMVRKKQSSADENSKDTLDIINFVHEYRENNQYDINSIPIIEAKEDRKIIKSFSNTKKLFEDLKKNRDLKFNYYDMNNSVTARNYFSKLAEYKINSKEWETIIKQINLKESGLSELFSKAKNSSGLVKDWFLPAIENKLKKDEDRIKNYRELIERYIKQYKANKEDIDRKEKIEIFNELSDELFNAADGFIQTNENREDLENKIANVIKYLNDELKAKENQEAEITQLIEKFKDDVEELLYEQASIEIYERAENVYNLEEEHTRLSEDISEKEEMKKSLTKKDNILECARIHRNYQEQSEEIQKLQTQLRILKDEKTDKLPQINDLGYTLKGIYSSELKYVTTSKEVKIEEKNTVLSEKEDLKKNVDSSTRLSGELKSEKGKLEAFIAAFNRIEDKFNRNYNENLLRNISGEFDREKILLFENNINKDKEKLINERKLISEKIINSENELKNKESQRNENIRHASRVNLELNTNKERLQKLNEEIQKRKEVIKYIDFTEEKVFFNDDIIAAFNNKIQFIKSEEINLRRNADCVVAEIEKLKSGTILELSKDMEEKLKEKDINIAYGMEWLKKNGYSQEKNQQLVNNNPFIPYSLIMNSNEIELLKNEELDIFTSTPISIINRSVLEKEMENISGDILEMGKINFLISFNNKLLDEEQLLKLIEIKEKDLETINQSIDNQEKTIKFYEEKMNSIKYSDLTLDKYNELKEKNNLLAEDEKELRRREIALEKDISKLKSFLKECDEKRKEVASCIEKNRNKELDFKELIDEYNKYIKNKDSLFRIRERIVVLDNEIKINENRINEIEGLVNESVELIRNYEVQENNLNGELIKYNVYDSGKIIEKDKEDLLAEFEALTKKFLANEEELNSRLNELNGKFKEVENELTTKASSYCLNEEEYIHEYYALNKELEVKNRLKSLEKELKDLNDNQKKVYGKKSKAEGKLEELYKKLNKDFGKEAPKSKELLINKNFKEEIAKVKIEIREYETKYRELSKVKNNISQNITNLSEFSHLNIINEINVDIPLENLNENVGKLKRDLANIKEEQHLKEDKLNKLVINIENNDNFKNESLFSEPFKILKALVSNPLAFKEHLNVVVETYKRMREKLIADIEILEKEESKILESVLEYIEEVHHNIGKIDDNSSITINNKRIKMLNIEVADWEINKEIYKIRLKEYIEEIRNQSLKALEENNNIEDIISNKINIYKLYDEVVGISNVRIKLYKIEEDKQRSITWDEVSKNSGGEGFLSAFVILSSLLSYMRKDEDDIFSRKEGGKVLIMDNPFAQTSSEHLLKPLIDIAKKSNTQLICLTGLGGDSIYNRFDNIYVLNLVSSKLKSGVKYLKSDHIKGEEEKDIIVASRFKIEEQIKLF